MIRFFKEYFTSAIFVGLLKTSYELADKLLNDGEVLSQIKHMLLHNFFVDGLIIGLGVGIFWEFMSKMKDIRNEIINISNNSVIDACNNIATESNKHIKTLTDTATEHYKEIDSKYNAISDSIRMELRNSNIYVAGIRKADSDIVHMLGQTAHRFVAEPDGVLILKVSSVVEYSQVCIELLKMTRKSVWSMSDMGLDQTFMLYCNTHTGISAWDSNGVEVRDWVTAVNTKAAAGLDVKRIQVVNSDRMALIAALNSYENLRTQQTIDDVLKVVRPSLRPNSGVTNIIVDNLFEGWQKYVELYANGAGLNNWFVYDQSDSHQEEQRRVGKCAIGEFIIFDEKYLVRFSSQTGILEVLVGKVVEVFAEQFENSPSLSKHSVAANNTTSKVLARH